MKTYGPWTIVGTRLIYQDRWLKLTQDDVIRPDGTPGTHNLVSMKAGVSVLPLDADGFVYLTEEFHYAVGRDTLEVVSGGIEPGEDALETAQRETLEELGIAAARWTALGSVDPFTSMAWSPTELYLARDLTLGASRPEGTERIRRHRCSLDEAVAMALNGTITHSASCILILKTHILLHSAADLPGE